MSMSDFDLHRLLSLAENTNRTINRILEEINRMSSNDQALTQAVTDLTNAFTGMGAAINAEIANLQASESAADPAVSQAAANIENIVAQMNQATTAAQAAIAPTANPTQAGSSVPDASSATTSAAQ